MIRFENGTEVQTLSVSGAPEMLRGHRRDVITITTTGIDYAQAASLFVDGAKWYIAEPGEGDAEQVYDWSSHNVAGPITDNRDGTLIVKMGKANTHEQDLEDKIEAETQTARMLANLAAPVMSDAQALSMPDLFPAWEDVLAAGEPLGKDTIIRRDSVLYRVVQDKTIPQAHQIPGGDGMLAVYRPIDPGHAGTIDDPIPWVYGMDCYKDKYYSHNGKTYLCKSDMIPCTWEPGTAGLWQWEEVHS